MALTVTEIEELRTYINGVMERADHHADQVNEIALALTGAILWCKEDAEPIKVMAQNGETKNVLWVRMGGARYAFSYNHESEQFEMRQGSTQGPTFTLSTTQRRWPTCDASSHRCELHTSQLGQPTTRSTGRSPRYAGLAPVTSGVREMGSERISELE